MDLADRPLWPLATGPDRTRWAAQAVERYLHLALLIMTRAATWPALEQPFSAQALEHARRLYEAIERRVDEPGRPPARTFCAPATSGPLSPTPPPGGPRLTYQWAA